MSSDEQPREWRCGLPVRPAGTVVELVIEAQQFQHAFSLCDGISTPLTSAAFWRAYLVGLSRTIRRTIEDLGPLVIRDLLAERVSPARHQIRPVIEDGAKIMDQIFPARSKRLSQADGRSAREKPNPK